MPMTKEQLKEIEQRKADLFPIYLEQFNDLYEQGKMIEAQSVARVAAGLLPLDSKDKDFKKLFKFAFSKVKKDWIKDYEERHRPVNADEEIPQVNKKGKKK